jgi:hypothetical protein
MISAPLHDLGPLQDRLRAIQPLPRNGPAPDEAAPAAEDTTDTDSAAEPVTEANDLVEDTAVPEDGGEPPAIPPEQDVESAAATQEEDDLQRPIEEPAATPGQTTEDRQDGHQTNLGR